MIVLVFFEEFGAFFEFWSSFGNVFSDELVVCAVFLCFFFFFFFVIFCLLLCFVFKDEDIVEVNEVRSNSRSEKDV